VLSRVMAMGGLGKRPGHMPGCNQGIWAGKYVPPSFPNGSPCSARCQEAKQALQIASAYRPQQQLPEGGPTTPRPTDRKARQVSDELP
jgi:hypothetical protein